MQLLRHQLPPQLQQQVRTAVLQQSSTDGHLKKRQSKCAHCSCSTSSNCATQHKGDKCGGQHQPGWQWGLHSQHSCSFPQPHARREPLTLQQASSWGSIRVLSLLVQCMHDATGKQRSNLNDQQDSQEALDKNSHSPACVLSACPLLSIELHE